MGIELYTRFKKSAQKAKVLADARICLSALTLELTENPDRPLSEIRVPENCKIQDTNTCICQYVQYTATCIVLDTGRVECSVQ